jgi:hypothetical protein
VNTKGEIMTYRITAWDVKTDKFSGLVYTQKVLLDKMAEAGEYTVERVFLYRDHEPMSHMTYEEV